MKNTIQEIEKEIVDEFSFFPEWMEKYEHLIDLGKNLPIIEEKYKTDDHLIKGCQSQVWLHADLEGDKIKFSRQRCCYYKGNHCSYDKGIK